ncbi:cytochrome P450 monooxygenase-like protein [Bisporella sp. PMI_857]|nr:cytochrome P450 monooxygenase-like protein [Bisporella sp. PMI_857]
MALILIAILSVLLVCTQIVVRNLWKNIAAAKGTGLRYVVVPFPATGAFTFIFNILASIISRKFSIKLWDTFKVITLNDAYHNPRALHDKYGDTFIIVSPFELLFKTCNAELISQIIPRRQDFIKPVQGYAIVAIFGSSLLTTEGEDFRRHKKVVAPSFSESTNRLVFEESLRQAHGIMDFWARAEGNNSNDIKVEDTSADAAVLSFHVICAAGFQLLQFWPGEDRQESKFRRRSSLTRLDKSGSYTLTFKESMDAVVSGLAWLRLFSITSLKRSPFTLHKNLYTAYNDCSKYYRDIFDLKKKEMQSGRNDENRMLDMMEAMVRASVDAPMDGERKPRGVYDPLLSKTEIIGNTFVFFLAGHETTGNSIHFCIVLLATHLEVQRKMQADIDHLLGKDKPLSELSYQQDMPLLFNSMIGAIIKEQLRIVPAILNIPKQATNDHTVTLDGKPLVIPNRAVVHLTSVGTHRNPKYWPSCESKVTPGTNDLNDFVPDRWLLNSIYHRNYYNSNPNLNENEFGDEKPAIKPVQDKTLFDTDTGMFFTPPKGAYIPFSEGMRSCPGKRFAQVEITAVLTGIFQRYTVELDVSEWATDEQVQEMSVEEKKAVYGKAIERARKVLNRCEQVLTLRMRRGDFVPVRFVARGQERFGDL